MALLKKIAFDPSRMEHRVVDGTHCYHWPEIGLRVAHADPVIAKEKADKVAQLMVELGEVSVDVVVEVVA